MLSAFPLRPCLRHVMLYAQIILAAAYGRLLPCTIS